MIESFDDMGLKEDLLRGIYSYGFEKPSNIQKKAIKPDLERLKTIANNVQLQPEDEEGIL